MSIRTVVFPLSPSDQQKEALIKTVSIYTEAFKECINVAWDMEKLSKNNLHKETYQELKGKLGLKSQYLCSARDRAFECVKAMRVLSRKGKKYPNPRVI